MGTTRPLTLVVGISVVAFGLLVWLASLCPASRPASGQSVRSVIVQGRETTAVAVAVRSVGGEITHRLGIINAVAARLSPGQREALATHHAVSRFIADRRVQYAGGPPDAGGGPTPDTHYPVLVGADLLHQEGIDGYGVTIAVLDTGVWDHQAIMKNADKAPRLVVAFDAIQNQMVDVDNDDNGHGTHVAAIMVSRTQSAGGPDGTFHGVAPNADLVTVKAFDAAGSGTYADLIRGIDWVVANRDAYGIRVLNCSFSAPPRSYYWDDPLNQALMRAWDAGIVVVASAGNTGPEPMTIGVPGNLPYLITVGAMSDNYTPKDPNDDPLASFSAAGPTYEAFVKPELVAPGGHMLAVMPTGGQLAQEHPEFHDGKSYFTMSGTSQAAAVVSGAVALMLQAAPALTPKERQVPAAGLGPAGGGRVGQPGLQPLPTGRRLDQRLRRRLQHQDGLCQP